MPNYRTEGFTRGMKNHYYVHRDSRISAAYEYQMQKNSSKPDIQKGATLMVSYRKRGNTWSYRTVLQTESITKRVEVGGFNSKDAAETAYLEWHKQSSSKSA